jgi:ABC-2 type transport system permease protein
VRKLLVIAWKEIVLRFTDPIVLLLTIVVPLVLATLVGLAFGNSVLGRGIPDVDIVVGIVNHDQGGRWGNFGQIFERVMIRETSPFPGDRLFELFAKRQFKDEDQARRMVEREELIAAVIIPPDFSRALETGGATVHLYVNGRSDIRGAAFKDVVETLANRISTAKVTVVTTVGGLVQYPHTRTRLEAGMLDEAIADLAVTAAMPASNPIKVQRVSDVGQSARIRLTHYLAAAMAILFTGFTGLVGSTSLLQEKAQWTLQRMHITPTRPAIILGGKTLGTYLSGLIQVMALIVGVIVMDRMLGTGSGQDVRIDLLGLSVLALSVVAAATGAGVIIAAFARTYVQAADYGRALLILMGLIGGIFFPVELFPRSVQVVTRLTFHYWAMDGYLRLATGEGVIGLLPNILVLTMMALLFFGVGNWLLRRRVGFF